MPLSDMECRNLKPPEKPRKVADGSGLYLFLQPGGGKLWRMNYRFAGRQKTLAFGAYPEVGLSEARRRRDDARTALAKGLDPATITIASGDTTFKAVAEDWLRHQKWVPAHKLRVESRLREDVFPVIGALDVRKVSSTDLLAALRKIEARGALEVAKRVRQTCGQIFRYAVAGGLAERDPSADLRDALRPSPRVKHITALRESDLPGFLVVLRGYDGDERTRLAIEVVLHTFVRTNEILGARSSEIEGDLWRIPAVRMKMGRPHLVPLTPHVAGLFDRLQDLAFDDRLAPLSQNTMIYALYRMGYHSRATMHGFRSTASTILNESGLWTADAIERQLAHVPGNTIRATYNAAQYLPERRRMMGWWSDRLLNLALDYKG